MRLTLTKQAEYALRMVVWLAQHDDAGIARHKSAQIAGAAGVPRAYAARVLARLHRHGLLLARAGQQGGYTLTRPGITLVEVIEAVEGPLTTPECVLRDTPCGTHELEPYCVLHDAWRTAREALRDVLAATPLSRAAAVLRDPERKLNSDDHD